MLFLDAGNSSNMSRGKRDVNFANLVGFRALKQSLSEAVDWQSKRKQLLDLALLSPAFAFVYVCESNCW